MPLPRIAGLRVGSRSTDVKHLNDYLVRFGYLASPAMRAADEQEFDVDTHQALLRFQQFYHLPATGVLDRDTLALMRLPRCGVPDEPGGSVGVVAGFVASGRQWTKTDLTYSFLNYSPDLTEQQIRDAIRQAFAIWSAVTPLTFAEILAFADKQANWRWCSKCQGLHFGGNGAGVCPTGGGHTNTGSGDYLLAHNAQSAAGQANWRWCSKCQGLHFGGNGAGVCPGGGGHVVSGSGNYTLVHNDSAAAGQSSWRWCSKCEILHFSGNAPGPCPAGGTHITTGSGNYTLASNTDTTGSADIVIRFAPGDHGDGYPFDGAGSVLAHGFYPPPNSGSLAGDLHFDEAETWTVNLPPSGIDLVTVAAHEIGHALGLNHSAVSGALMYAYYGGAHRNLEQDDTDGIRSLYGTVARQANWRWCSKCQGLHFGGNSAGACPAGGTHVTAASGNYALAHNSSVAPGQSDWRWCSKCQGLHFGGNGVGVCPAGGGHITTGSGNYTLLHNSNSQIGQANWRWCSKCEGLHFGGNSAGACAAGGTHITTGSGNYTLMFG